MREIRQKEAEIAFLNSNRKSIINCTPRFGKTKVGLEIINSGYKNVLVAYPKKPVRVSWEQEMEKWNLKLPVVFTTHISLKKNLSKDYDLIIIDEIHELSAAQIETLKNFLNPNQNIHVLGLSGTLSFSTESNLRKELNLTTCYKYSLEQAIEEKIVSDYEIIIHEVSLDNTVPRYKNLTEKQKFNKLSRTIDYLDSQGRSTFYLRLQRMRIIQDSYSKLLKTRQLLKNSNKSLVFCGTTKIADGLGCKVFHSKSSEKSIVEEFSKANSGHLAVCKMLNVGVTILNLEEVIINYFTSNEETLVQQINRCMNHEYSGKKARIKIISTNEETEKSWLKKALKTLNPSKITWKKQ